MTTLNNPKRKPTQAPITRSVDPRESGLASPSRPTFDVPTLIRDIESGLKQLKSNAAAFAAMNRAAESMVAQSMPIMTWTAALDGGPLEITSDLNELERGSQQLLLDGLINLHGKEMYQNALKIVESAKDLCDQLAASVEDQQSTQEEATGDNEDQGGDPVQEIHHG